jgi:membrane protein implicated in regulation of membrane protease activity
MPWWGWLAFGAVLLGAEIAIATDFWLATVGAGAMALGLLLTVIEAPRTWIQWILFAALAVLFNAVVRRRIRARPPGLEPELVGESGIALAAIAPGAQGSVEVRGTTWQARNVGPEALAPRAPVLVTAVRGIMLDVRG